MTMPVERSRWRRHYITNTITDIYIDKRAMEAIERTLMSGVDDGGVDNTVV